MSKVLPSGLINKLESPSPTSMEVSSSTPGRNCGEGAMTARTTEAARMAARPMQATARWRRAPHIASPSAAAASSITITEGTATRRSAICIAPSPRTVPMMPCSASMVSSTGIFASHTQTVPKASALIAAGISNCVRGTTSKFAGNPSVVAR